MIQWSRQRAREERVEDKVESRIANVLDLPFAEDRFDVVIIESVLAFVADKEQAIRECERVVKTGGYVGLNEAVWIQEAPPDMVAAACNLGTEIPSAETWRTLWDESALRNREVRIRQLDARREMRSRLQWVGWRWLLRAWGRLIILYATDPAARQSIKQQLNTPLEIFQYVGYGLFSGRK